MGVILVKLVIETAWVALAIYNSTPAYKKQIQFWNRNYKNWNLPQ